MYPRPWHCPGILRMILQVAIEDSRPGVAHEDAVPAATTSSAVMVGSTSRPGAWVILRDRHDGTQP